MQSRIDRLEPSGADLVGWLDAQRLGMQASFVKSNFKKTWHNSGHPSIGLGDPLPLQLAAIQYMLESHIGRVGQNPKHIARGQTGQYTINVISTKFADVPHCGTDMTTFELYTCPLACEFVLNLESLSLE